MPRFVKHQQHDITIHGIKMGGVEKPRSAVIVGAGVGGVATAARLAEAGWKVTVVEKNDFTGGRCSLINRDGYVCYRY